MLEGFYPLEARQQQVALTHLFPLLLGEDSIHCCTAQSETSAQGRPFHGPGGVPDEGVRALAETDRVASLTPGACEFSSRSCPLSPPAGANRRPLVFPPLSSVRVRLPPWLSRSIDCPPSITVRVVATYDPTGEGVGSMALEHEVRLVTHSRPTVFRQRRVIQTRWSLYRNHSGAPRNIRVPHQGGAS